MKLVLCVSTIIFTFEYSRCAYKSSFGKDETLLNNSYFVKKDITSEVDDIERYNRGEVSSEIEYEIESSNTNKNFAGTAFKRRNLNNAGDDPATHLSTPQLIAMNGYPAESHTIVTEDGYILTIHRIPSKRNARDIAESPRRTVLLHHGVLSSSVDWVLTGPRKALAYILSDAGYDVWMANARGNTYSRAHVSRNVNSFKFWNYTFHEIGYYDVSATIDYIMNVNGWDTKIDYIGHSMGTTVLFVLLSTKPHYNKILRSGFALAPVAYMSDVKSPVRYLARFANDIEYLSKLFGANEFLPHPLILRWLSQRACEINNWDETICEDSLFVLCGFDAKEFNKTLFPMIFGHHPAGASTKTLVHYLQEISQKGAFQQYDYGTQGNLKRYGTKLPPKYPLKNISLPIVLFSAKNDWLASETDVDNLYKALGNVIENYVVPMKEFNHIDFLWANDAPKLVYKKLLSLLAENIGEWRIADIKKRKTINV